MELKSYIKRFGPAPASPVAATPVASTPGQGRQPPPPQRQPPPRPGTSQPLHAPAKQPFTTVAGQRPFPGRGATQNSAAPRSVSYSPKQLATFYGFPTNATGVGTKIAVIELGGGYVQADLDRYFTGLGLTVKPVVFHSIDGAKNAPGDPNGADGEVMLDLCVAGAMAPGAELHCYMAPNTDAGFLDAINQAITDKMTAISISWGAPEADWTASSITAYNAAFQRAVDAGITVTAAAGDSGSSDGLAGKNVDFPASSPLVLGCGGTSLPSLSTSAEAVWNDGGGVATGGGISALFALPAYQAKANVPGARYRGVPDVAGNADPSTGWNVIIDGSNYVIGGTSAVAPMWAALAACLTQALGKNVGFLNSALYSLTGWYRDVLSGNNGAYSARSGYDCCTGMGVPVGTKLLTALQTVTPTPAPTPTPVQPTPDPVPTPPAPTPTTTTHTIVVTGTGTVITVDGKSVA
jgi:kumamolisin